MFARILTALALFAMAASLFLFLSRSHQGYGLDDLVGGRRLGTPEKLTLPSASPLSEGDVPGLARLNNEVTTLIATVAPAVVSVNTARVTRRQAIDFFGNVRLLCARTWVRRDHQQGRSHGHELSCRRASR
jgi:S1-C subfamily serine protease